MCLITYEGNFICLYRSFSTFFSIILSASEIMIFSFFFLFTLSNQQQEENITLIKAETLYANYSITFHNSSILNKTKKIGSGKFSEVFKGEFPNGTEIAIKELNPGENGI